MKTCKMDSNFKMRECDHNGTRCSEICIKKGLKFMEKATVVINEQHSLMDAQVDILKENFDYWEEVRVPASGWDSDDIMYETSKLEGTVVFVSPIPQMIKYCSIDAAIKEARNYDHGGILPEPMSKCLRCMIMCNDQREKKELSNGKIIHVVSQKGWYLFE